MKLQRQVSSFFVFIIMGFLFIVFPYSSAEAWKVRNYYQDAIGIKCNDCRGFSAFKQYPVSIGATLDCPAAENKCGGGNGAQLAIFWPGSDIACRDIQLGVKVPAHGLIEIHPTQYWVYSTEETIGKKPIQYVDLGKADLLCPKSN